MIGNVSMTIKHINFILKPLNSLCISNYHGIEIDTSKGSLHMRITVPFTPGYTFWSPRVRSHSELHAITHEGKDYTRREETLQISAKHKKITQVEITLRENGEPSFQYWAVNTDGTPNWPTLLPTLVDPHSGFNTESDAIDFARHWRDTQGTEYFGEAADSSQDQE